MFLIKVLGINLNFEVFIAFFLGIFSGVVLLLLVYLYVALRGLRKGLKRREVEEEDIDEEEIKWMIKSSQETFKNKKVRQEVGYGTLLIQEVKDLSVDISKKFYPNSAYPYLELTIDETIELSYYITNRIKELVESNMFLRMFRGMTLRKIVELNNTKVQIEESRFVKAAKKTRLTKIASTALKVINVANPFYWFRKATVDQAVNIVLVRIGLAIIEITGQETYKVYSKKVFDVDKELEPEVSDLYEAIKKDFEEEEYKDEWEA